MTTKVEINSTDGIATLHFRTIEDAQRAARWINASINGSATVLIPKFLADNAVAEFHRQRGCCDGSDPRACWEARNREQEAHMQARREERERQKRSKRNPFSEYEGTE